MILIHFSILESLFIFINLTWVKNEFEYIQILKFILRWFSKWGEFSNLEKKKIIIKTLEQVRTPTTDIGRK